MYIPPLGWILISIGFERDYADASQSEILVGGERDGVRVDAYETAIPTVNRVGCRGKRDYGRL